MANDAELRFQASLEDDASPQIDALIRKLQAAGATPTEIKMYLRAQDEATPHIEKARKLMESMPKDHTFRFRVASDEARAHLSSLKREFSEPIRVPLQFTDNLETIGQKLFTFKSRYAVPMAGMIPGANMLYGVGMGAGILGAAGGASDLIKKSVDVNAELQQQNAALTQALKDNTAATQEMGKVMGMAGNSQFGRGDMTQADIIARQFNLPSFAGESKYMPQGVLPQAQNLAAVGQTSVTQAAQAIAGATQGYFRQLLPYGISIKQEDFSPGGRFAGKSYQQAIDEATKRFQGAAEEQAKTFTGMLQRFHNMFEDKILQPLGMFTFSQLGSTLQNMLGGGTQKGFENFISNKVNAAQEELTKFWNLVQKGKSYFEVNLKKPLEDIVSSIIKIGAAFGKAFGATMLAVLKTLGEALTAIIRPITQLISSHSGLVEFFGVMKALSVLGFKDISAPFVNPLKDLATLHWGSALKDLAALPGALTKVGIALVVKSFVEAHQATKALNDQFPSLKQHFADINSEVTIMAAKLDESSTHMKELVATAGQGLPKSLGDQHRLDLSEKVATAGVQLHQQFNIPEMDAVRMLAQQMKASGDYSDKAIRDFGTELGEAQSAAKSLGYSFSDLQRIMTQYASVAGPVGLGGLGGAAALTGIQSGFDKIQMTDAQRKLYPTRDAMMSAMLQQYSNPSGTDLQALGGASHLSKYYNFKAPTTHQMNTFLGNQGTLLQQYNTAMSSNREAQAVIRKAAPDLNVLPTPVSERSRYIGMSTQSMRNIQRDRHDPNALGRDVATAREQDVKIYKEINDEVQKLEINIGGLTNKVADYQNAQARLNLHIEAFQHALVPLQQQIEDQSLALQKYTFDVLHPLERQMTRLNEVMAENQHTMSNAQYEQSKWADSLFIGEQKALDQLHALENYNKQLQLLQLIYQQIGGDLGTTIYDQGAEIKVAPMTNIGLAMAQQVAQRKEAIAQTKYDLNYGEKHYQASQAQRSIFQRTERDFSQVIQHIKSNQGIIDTTSQQAHNLDNVAFGLQQSTYKANEHIQNMQDKITGLQITLTALQQSKKMRQFQEDAYHLGRDAEKAGNEVNRLTQHMSSLKNLLTDQGPKSNLTKLFGQTLDFSGKNSFANARRVITEALHSQFLSPGEAKRILGQVNTAEQATRTASAKHWYQNDKTFGNVLKTVLKDVFYPQHILSGRTFRDAADAAHSIPVIGKHLPSGTAAEVLAALGVGYLGISTVGAGRQLVRAGTYRLGARAIDAVAPHIPGIRGLYNRAIPWLGRVGEAFALRRGARAQARLEHLSQIEDPSWLQQRRYRNAEITRDRAGQVVEISRKLQHGEGYAHDLADAATAHSIARAREKFQWIRRFRERVGGGIAAAGARGLGTYLGGSGVGQLAATATEYYAGQHFADHSTLELSKEGIKEIKKVVKYAENIHAQILAHAPLDTPQELRDQAREVVAQLKNANLTLSTVKDLQKAAEGKLGAALAKQDRVLNNPAATDAEKALVQRQVDTARRQIENVKKFEHAATETRASAVEVRKELGKKITEFGNKVHGAADKMDKAGTKQDKASAKQEKAGDKQHAAGEKQEHAGSKQEHAGGEQEHAGKTMGHEAGRFGKVIAGLTVVAASFKTGVDEFLGKHPHVNKITNDAATAIKKAVHKVGKQEPIFNENTGRWRDPSTGHFVPAPHTGEAHLGDWVPRLGKGIKRVGVFAGAHGPNAFYAHGNILGALSGDTQSEAWMGAATGETIVRAIRARVQSGSGREALAKHVVEKYGEELGLKTGARVAGSSALKILAGATPGVGQAYDIYTMIQIMRDLTKNRNTLTDRYNLGHPINPMRPGATGSASLVQKMREGYETPEIQNYLKAHQTTLVEMEKIYASGGKIPVMFTTFFKNQLQLSQEAAQKDLKQLGDTHDTIKANITQHFKDRSQITQDGQKQVNTDEQNGWNNILDTTSGGTNAVIKAIKKMDKALGLTTNATPADTRAAGGGSPATSSAGVTAGQYAAGGITMAAAHELASRGGKLIKVGEEGPEMIVPLMPHRRERAKSLINQAKGIIGMANGGYVNPFSSVGNLAPERVDMGVDYSGNGKVRALGDAQVVTVANVPQNQYGGGGGWVTYQLLNGTNKGRYVFLGEHVSPLVRQGQKVSAGDVIANIFGGIETGWAAGPGQWNTLAASLGQQNKAGDPGEFPTAAGASFSNLLQQVGAPGGIINGQPHGSMKGVPDTGNVQVGGMSSIRWPKSLDHLKYMGLVGPRVRRILRRHINAYNRMARSSGVFDPNARPTHGKLSFNQTAALAESVGLPGVAFAQIARGESGFDPHAVGHDPGGTEGLGLWQITTKYNDDIIKRFGGRNSMFNAHTNALAAKAIYDRQGIKAWYGTKYLTDPTAHYSGKLPHYHSGSWHVGEDVPSVLQKGEMVLPKSLAQSIRQNVGGLNKQTLDGASGKMVRHLEEIVDSMSRVEKQLKDLNDKTDKNNARDHLSQLNSELRRNRNVVTARQNAAESKAITGLLSGDQSDGEATVAQVDRERRRYLKATRAHPDAGLTGADKKVAHHVATLAKSAHHLVNTAHTKHQRDLAHTAVRAVAKAQRDVTHVRNLAGKIHETRTSTNYIVGAAKRHIDDHLIKSITGRRMTKEETHDYRVLAGHRLRDKHGHLAAPSKAQTDAATKELRRDLNKGLSGMQKHLEALRKEANTHTKEAQKATERAARAQGKAVLSNGKLVSRATYEAIKRQREDSKKSTKTQTHATAAAARVQEHAQKVTAAISDRADKNRSKEQAANDKRDRDHQKKVITLLENISNRDLSVSIHNEAHGAKLKTTSTRTRRRKR